MNNADPVLLLFVLLQACRSTQNEAAWALQRACRRRGVRLSPRLSFWVRLGQAATLLDEQRPPRPTLLVPQWLAQPRGEQLAHLLQAWTRVPLTPVQQRLRRRLLDLLSSHAELTPAYRRELPGLQALGVCRGDQLTPAGAALLAGEIQAIPTPAPAAWQIAGDQLHAPLPPDWALVWELEAYVDGQVHLAEQRLIYSLAPDALQQAAQRGPLDPFLHILERGLGQPPPADLVTAIRGQPTIRVLPGPVLEFSDPQQLLRLRESPALRRELEQVLSPRHVRLDPHGAPDVLRRLGLALPPSQPLPETPASKRTAPVDVDFSTADRAYLLSLALLAEKLDAPLAPPLGLMHKLEAGLDDALRAAASRQAQAALRPSAPAGRPPVEDELAPGPTPDLLASLQDAIAKQETIDVLYHVPGRPSAERRRLAPLLIEPRGPHTYLLAYCHTRRANRTFRLDRLQLA